MKHSVLKKFCISSRSVTLAWTLISTDIDSKSFCMKLPALFEMPKGSGCAGTHRWNCWKTFLLLLVMISHEPMSKNTYRKLLQDGSQKRTSKKFLANAAITMKLRISGRGGDYECFLIQMMSVFSSIRSRLS